jgi:tRNA/tmRNA/rRNA uracil-C5-methylase (TrmA/RlmC/RlmD family)
VIAAIAARKPLRVAHIFCGPEEIRRSIIEWKAAGYIARSLEPIDMFPGTDGLEVILQLERV